MAKKKVKINRVEIQHADRQWSELLTFESAFGIRCSWRDARQDNSFVSIDSTDGVNLNILASDILQIKVTPVEEEHETI